MRKVDSSHFKYGDFSREYPSVTSTYWREFSSIFVNDWVESDDGWVVKVLAVYEGKNKKGMYFKMFRTSWGCYSIRDKSFTVGDRKKGSYFSSGGRYSPKKKLQPKDFLWMDLVMSGRDPIIAGKIVFGSGYNCHLVSLNQNRNAREYMADKLKDVLERLEINAEWLLAGYKSIVISAYRDSDKLVALGKLAEFLNLKPEEDRSGSSPLMQLQLTEKEIEKLSNYTVTTIQQEVVEPILITDGNK